MENETEIKISIEKIKGEINLIHQKLEMFETNHLPHIEKQIDKLTSLLDKEKKPAVTKKSSKKDKKKALSYYKRGLKKAKKKDYKGALKDLKISYKLDPNKKIKAKLDSKFDLKITLYETPRNFVTYSGS